MYWTIGTEQGIHGSRSDSPAGQYDKSPTKAGVPMPKNLLKCDTVFLHEALAFLAVVSICCGTVLAQTTEGVDQSIVVAEGGGNHIPQLAEEAIRKKLSRQVTLSLCSCPLEDFVNSLAKQLAVNVVIDRTAIEEISHTATMPITLEVDDISARSALNIILRPSELDWMVRDEALIITTAEEAEQNLRPVVYDVTDLVNVTADNDSETEIDFNSLIELVHFQVAPDTWAEGNSSDVVGYQLNEKNLLIISQSDSVHYEITRFFLSLRNASKAKP